MSVDVPHDTESVDEYLQQVYAKEFWQEAICLDVAESDEMDDDANRAGHGCPSCTEMLNTLFIEMHATYHRQLLQGQGAALVQPAIFLASWKKLVLLPKDSTPIPRGLLVINFFSRSIMYKHSMLLG